MGEQTFDPKVLGLRDAAQTVTDVEVKTFAEIEAEAASFGVTRDDLEGAIKKPSPSMQEMYAFIVTRALMAKRDAASKKDHRGYPIADKTSTQKNPQPDIYALVERTGQVCSVSLMRTDGKPTSYVLSRETDRVGRPQYKAEYSGKKKSAVPDNTGSNPFGGGIFNPDLKHEVIQTNSLQWVFGRLGGFPPGFMASAEAPVGK